MKVNNPLRVLHCPVLALYQSDLMARGLREAGIESDSMVFDFGDDRWLSLGVDINLGLDNCGNLQRFFSILSFLMKAASHYDVFHFHSGRSLLPLWIDSRWSPLPESLHSRLWILRRWDFADLRLLRRLGKKIVFSFWGCDIRKPTDLSENPDYMCNYCLPQERQCDTPFRSHLDRNLRKYSDAVVLSGDLVHSWHDYHWLPNAIDLETWNPKKVKEQIPGKYRLDKEGKLLILHAFANSDKRGDHKGSPFVDETVRALEAEGLPVKYVNLDGFAVQDMKYFQVQADIIIDQFRLGSYGSFAMESMALGKPVVGWIEPTFFNDQVEPPPIISTPLDGLKNTLIDLIRNRERLRKIGLESRKYAESIHDYKIIGRELKRIYEGLFRT